MEQYAFWIVAAVVVIAVVVIAARSFASRIVVAVARWLEPIDARPVFDQKLRLLENSSLVEALAPAAEFTREYGENEKRRKPRYFLSPWPLALKTAWKKHKNSSRKVDITAQLKHAASQLLVELLDDERQPANAGPDHFRVVVPLDHNTEEAVARLAGYVKATLGLHQVEASLTEDNLAVEFVCHAVAPEDKLGKQVFNVRWLDEHPASTWKHLPVGVNSLSEMVNFELHQTMIYGVSGAGKGSVLHSMIRQMAPFVARGEVSMYGIDTKNEDIGVYRNSRLFKAFVSDPGDVAAMIEYLYAEMKLRAASRVQDLDAGETGMKVKLGADGHDVKVLWWDEYMAAMLELKLDKNYRRLRAQIETLMAEGRSLGFFIVAAGQTMDHDLMERQRDLFINGISLKAKRAYWAEQVLGEEAPEAKLAVQIPASTPGVGYLREGLDGEPQRVRFPFTSEEDVLKLLREWGLRESGEATEFSKWKTAKALAPKNTAPKVNAPPAKPQAAEPVSSATVSPSPSETQSSRRPRPMPLDVAPAADSSSKVSVTDSLATILKAPDAELKARGRALRAALSGREDAQQRHMLQEIARELRIRRQLADMPKVQPDPDSIVLPDLNL